MSMYGGTPRVLPAAMRNPKKSAHQHRHLDKAKAINPPTKEQGFFPMFPLKTGSQDRLNPERRL